MYRFFVVVPFLILVLACASACGGLRYPSDFEVQGAHGMEVSHGPAVREARELLLALSAELRRHAAAPEGAAQRFEAWLSERAPIMRANALALRAEVDALEGDARAAWEFQFAEYLRDAHAEWLEAREALIAAHADTARQILELIPELPARSGADTD